MRVSAFAVQNGKSGETASTGLLSVLADRAEHGPMVSIDSHASLYTELSKGIAEGSSLMCTPSAPNPEIMRLQGSTATIIPRLINCGHSLQRLATAATHRSSRPANARWLSSILAGRECARRAAAGVAYPLEQG